MELPVFVDSEHCIKETFCMACRDKENGRIVRQLMALQYQMPVENFPDFDCPFKKQWGYQADPAAIEQSKRARETPQEAWKRKMKPWLNDDGSYSSHDLITGKFKQIESELEI